MSDDQLRRDLATVGRASRARAVSLDTTLAAVGATADARRVRHVVTARDAMLVTASRLYAARVAWIVTGTVCVLFNLARLVDVMLPNWSGSGRTDIAVQFLWEHSNLARVTAALVVIHLLVGASARRRFSNAIEGSLEPHVDARRRIDAVARWSFTTMVAGVSAYIGMAVADSQTLEGMGFLWFQADGSYLSPLDGALWVTVPAAFALVVIVIGAGLVARWSRPGPFGRWIAVPGAALVAVNWKSGEDYWITGLRIAFMFLGVGVLVLGYVKYRRHEEAQMLATEVT